MTQPDKSYTREQALADLAEIDRRQTRPHGYREIREGDHVEADEILLRLIGDAEISAAFERIEKWYA